MIEKYSIGRLVRVLFGHPISEQMNAVQTRMTTEQSRLNGIGLVGVGIIVIMRSTENSGILTKEKEERNQLSVCVCVYV